MIPVGSNTNQIYHNYMRDRGFSLLNLCLERNESSAAKSRPVGTSSRSNASGASPHQTMAPSSRKIGSAARLSVRRCYSMNLKTWAS